jgi:hypothetical protein
MAILILISPGVISALYYCKQKQIPLKSIDFLVYTIIFSFVINVFITSLMYLRGHKDGLSIEIFSLIGNAARYGLLALAGSFIFPSIILLVEKIFHGKNK